MNVANIGNSAALHVMSGASAGLPPQQKMSSLFEQIDSSGSGSITQAQFAQAFQTLNPPAVFQQQGADAIFAALDPTGTGSVSKPDFVSVMPGLMASLRAEGGPSTAPGPSPGDSLNASLQLLGSIDPNSVPSGAAPGTLINTKA